MQIEDENYTIYILRNLDTGHFYLGKVKSKWLKDRISATKNDLSNQVFFNKPFQEQFTSWERISLEVAFVGHKDKANGHYIDSFESLVTDPLFCNKQRKHLQFEPAVYILTNRKNGLFYVGSTNQLRRRVAAHKSMLLKGVHSCIPWQNSFTKWEDYDLWFEYVKDNNEGKIKEQALLDKHSDNKLCCNQSSNSRGGNINSAVPLTEQHRKNRSEAQMGKRHSEETRRKMSASQTGKVVSEETRAKFSQIHKGKTVSDETKEKLRQANLGKVNTSAHKAVVLDGVWYKSQEEAERILKLGRGTVYARIKGRTKGYPNWRYATHEDAPPG